jgi:hypothetical protein
MDEKGTETMSEKESFGKGNDGTTSKKLCNTTNPVVSPKKVLLIGLVMVVLFVAGCSSSAKVDNELYLTCKFSYCNAHNQTMYAVESLVATGKWYCVCLGTEGLIHRYEFEPKVGVKG